MKLIKFRVVIRFAYSLLITPRVGGGRGGGGGVPGGGGGRNCSSLAHLRAREKESKGARRGDKEERDGEEIKLLMASLMRLSSNIPTSAPFPLQKCVFSPRMN